MARWLRGRLLDPSSAPAEGETVVPLLDGPVSVEQILSGRTAAPVDYRQDEHEWVVLLAGTARLLVDGAEVELVAGDWLLLPAGCAHTLTETAPGSSWLAVRFGAPPLLA